MMLPDAPWSIVKLLQFCHHCRNAAPPFSPLFSSFFLYPMHLGLSCMHFRCPDGRCFDKHDVNTLKRSRPTPTPAPAPSSPHNSNPRENPALRPQLTRAKIQAVMTLDDAAEALRARTDAINTFLSTAVPQFNVTLVGDSAVSDGPAIAGGSARGGFAPCLPKQR